MVPAINSQCMCDFVSITTLPATMSYPIYVSKNKTSYSFKGMHCVNFTKNVLFERYNIWHNPLATMIGN